MPSIRISQGSLQEWTSQAVKYYRTYFSDGEIAAEDAFGYVPNRSRRKFFVRSRNSYLTLTWSLKHESLDFLCGLGRKGASEKIGRVQH